MILVSHSLIIVINKGLNIYSGKYGLGVLVVVSIENRSVIGTFEHDPASLDMLGEKLR